MKDWMKFKNLKENMKFKNSNKIILKKIMNFKKNIKKFMKKNYNRNNSQFNIKKWQKIPKKSTLSISK